MILVTVNTNHPYFIAVFYTVNCFLDSTYTYATSSSKDNFYTAVKHLGSKLCTCFSISEGTLIDNVFRFDYNVCSKVFICISYALLEAPVKFLNRRNFHTADKSGFAFFQLKGSCNTSQEA